jgi:hypothetical protein
VFDTIRRAVSDYQSEWREYRRLLYWFLACVLAALPFFALILAFPKLHDRWYVAASVWLIPFFYVFMRLNLWKCPRCGKYFSSGSTGYAKVSRFVSVRYSFLPPILLTPRCVHCKLTKYSD